MNSIRKPRLVIFAGHRIDAAGRKVPRFPEKSCSAVKKRLKDKLIELRPDLGIASAADGGDILFHECLMELNRWSHVILPAPPEHFIHRMEEEVGSGWASRCRRVVQEAAQVEVSSYSRFETVPEDVYRLSSDYLLAYTSDMKQVYDGDLFPLVLWDSKPVRYSGGTGYVVSRLRALGFEPESISIDLRSGGREADTSSVEAETSLDYSSLGIYQAVLRPVVMIRTYSSGETEEKMASGITRILSAMSDITESFSSGFQACGTMGNTFYLLLESTDDVLTILNGLDRIRKDMPDHSLLLHAGIVTMLEASLGGKRNYHCSEIADLQELAAAIRKPSRIATMQFRSLVDPEGGIDFSYSGRFTSSRGTRLKIFHLN